MEPEKNLMQIYTRTDKKSALEVIYTRTDKDGSKVEIVDNNFAACAYADEHLVENCDDFNFQNGLSFTGNSTGILPAVAKVQAGIGKASGVENQVPNQTETRYFVRPHQMPNMNVQVENAVTKAMQIGTDNAAVVYNSTADKKQVKQEIKVNPSITAKDFASKFSFKIYKGEVYCLVGAVYKLFLEDSFRMLLNQFYRNEAETFGSARFYDEVLRFIKCEGSAVVNEYDEAMLRNYICFADGYLDLSGMEWLPPNKNIFFRKYINLKTSDFINCQEPVVFKQFLYMIAGGDEILMQRILEVMGYVFSNDLSAKAFFIFQGVPDSGKSTLLELIKSFFDEEFSAALNIEDFEKQFAVSELFDKAINICGELTGLPIKATAISRLKQLTGNDLISCDVKYKSHIKFKNSAKFLFATNNSVNLDYMDEAFLKRIIVVPFKYSATVKDRGLLMKLLNEKAGIFQLCVKHYVQLKQKDYCFAGNYPLNEVCQNVHSNKATNWMPQFLDEVLEPDPNAYVFVEDLLREFQAYAERNGFVCTWDILGFGKELRKYFPNENFGKLRRLGGANPQSMLKGYKIKGQE